MTVQHDRNHTTGRPTAGDRASRAGLHEAWIRGCADAVFGRTVTVYRTETERCAWRLGYDTSRTLEHTR